MDRKNIEVELKFPLKNYEELVRNLNLIGQLERKDSYQKDIYYVPPHRDFLKQKPISEWLRIRETEKGFTITYKNWHNSGNKKTISCDELGTAIIDGISLKTILKNLNFREIVVVEKIRSMWIYKNVEISIDKVTNLGNFIELEIRRNFKNVQEAKAHLHSILKEVNAKVGSQDFKGYPIRILKQKGLVD